MRLALTLFRPQSYKTRLIANKNVRQEHCVCCALS